MQPLRNIRYKYLSVNFLLWLGQKEAAAFVGLVLYFKTWVNTRKLCQRLFSTGLFVRRLVNVDSPSYFICIYLTRQVTKSLSWCSCSNVSVIYSKPGKGTRFYFTMTALGNKHVTRNLRTFLHFDLSLLSFHIGRIVLEHCLTHFCVQSCSASRLIPRETLVNAFDIAFVQRYWQDKSSLFQKHWFTVVKRYCANGRKQSTIWVLILF